VRAKLDKYPFAAVLDRREPRGLQSDLRALNVGFVLPLDVRRDGLEAREPDERQDLAQTMELDYGLDAVVALGAAPGRIGQPAGVEVRIDGHVVAKALGRREQCFELDLFHRPLALLAALDLLDGVKDLIVREWCQLLRDSREPLEHSERLDRVHSQ